MFCSRKITSSLVNIGQVGALLVGYTGLINASYFSYSEVKKYFSGDVIGSYVVGTIAGAMIPVGINSAVIANGYYSGKITGDTKYLKRYVANLFSYGVISNAVYFAYNEVLELCKEGQSCHLFEGAEYVFGSIAGDVAATICLVGTYYLGEWVTTPAHYEAI